MKELLEQIPNHICVASNSSKKYISNVLEMTNLSKFFKNNIFSAIEIGIPKPAPDLFLLAAQNAGIPFVNLWVDYILTRS